MISNLNEKWCNTGEHWVSVSEFGKHQKSHDGLRACCKECNNKKAREYHAANRDTISNRSKKWRENNKDLIVALRKDYAERNGEKIAQGKRNYYEANKERIKASIAQYKKDNSCKVNGWARNRHSIKRASGNGVNVDYELIKVRDDMVCGICNLKVEDNLHFDHIIPISKGGAHTEDNVQVAHSICNLRKGAGTWGAGR